MSARALQEQLREAITRPYDVAASVRGYLAELKERGPILDGLDDVRPLRHITFTAARSPGYLDALGEVIARAAERE